MAFPPKKTAPVPPVKKKGKPVKTAAKPMPAQWQGVANKMLGSKTGPGAC